ncbi:hypothetical protein FHS14_001680 [Paenibacillus baekrokdamisoli]|nr:hypothetical protein [Paenibacillus baekrokdamisoli]MBB3068693.1 hypothetical protein [Paenibacillus baekrokdamisoli]
MIISAAASSSNHLCTAGILTGHPIRMVAGMKGSPSLIIHDRAGR